MLFAWLLIWPNAELPNTELAGAAHWTMLNMFSTSRRMFSVGLAAGLHVLATDRSKLSRHGDSTPGSARGALPKVFSAEVENAALLK